MKIKLWTQHTIYNTWRVIVIFYGQSHSKSFFFKIPFTKKKKEVLG